MRSSRWSTVPVGTEAAGATAVLSSYCQILALVSCMRENWSEPLWPPPRTNCADRVEPVSSRAPLNTKMRGILIGTPFADDLAAVRKRAFALVQDCNAGFRADWNGAEFNTRAAIS